MITPSQLIVIVSEQYRVTMRELKSGTRIARVVEARQVAMFLLRKIFSLSYPRIGLMFRRDHTTVISACNKIEEMYRLRGIEKQVQKKSKIKLTPDSKIFEQIVNDMALLQ